MPTIYEVIQKYKAKDHEGVKLNFEINGEFQRYLDLAKIKELSNIELIALITIFSGILTNKLKEE